MSEMPQRFPSIGAAVRDRIQVDAQGNFPITRTLIAVLAFAVVLFNQGLFWLLAVLLHGQGRPIAAGRFLVASLGVGVALWAILVVLHFRFTGGARRNDNLVMILTGGLLIAGVTAASPGCALAATVAFTAWAARGFKKMG
jgi:hypothetical protein